MDNSYDSPDLQLESYPDLQLNLASLQREKVSNGFIEASAINLALDSGGKESTYISQVVPGDKGVDQIIAPGHGDKQVVFSASSKVYFDDAHSITTINGDLNEKDIYSGTVEITLSPAHSEKVKLIDARDSTFLETVGGCSPRDGQPDRCDFTVGLGKTQYAVIEGTRTWLSGDNTKTHYNLFSPTQRTKKLASIDIDRSVEDGIVTMKVAINKQSPEH